MRKNVLQYLLLPVAAAVLVACGGGGGSAASPEAPTFSLTGVAATGAPVVGAQLTVLDASGNSVATGTTNEQGGFAVSVPLSSQAPFFVRVTKDQIDLTSVYTDKADGKVNVNPLTDAVVSMASPTGDNSRLAEDLKSGKTVSVEELKAKVDLLLAALKPLIEAIETSTGKTIGNFMNGELEAGTGQGLDKLLDSVGVNKSLVTENGKTVTTSEINFKTSMTDEAAAPKVIKVAATDTVSAVQQKAAAVTIDPSELIIDEAPALYLSLLQTINECYAQPVTTRTDGDTVVKSEACKAMFVDQDYEKFLNGGVRVGKGKAFNGLFTYNKEVKFSPAKDAYLRQDLGGSGHAIVSMTWINEDGNKENIYHYVKKYQRKDSNGQPLTANGKPVYALGITGDQNIHPFSVESHNVVNNYLLLKNASGERDTSWDFVNSGYLLIIKSFNIDGKRILGAEVESPSGKIIRMAPDSSGSRADLAICKKDQTFNTSTLNSTCDGSKLITMAESFVDPTRQDKPSDYMDLGLVRPLNASGQPYTPTTQEVQEQKILGQWTATIYLEGGETRQVKARHVARPMTAPELLSGDGPGAKMASYTDDSIKAIKDLRYADGPLKNFGVTAGNPEPAVAVPAPASGGFKFAWQKSPGQYSPTWLWASGRTQVFNTEERQAIGKDTRPFWDDIVGVLSTQKEGAVTCSRASGIDIHCAPVSFDREKNGDALTGRIVNVVQDQSSSLNYNRLVWMSYSELGMKDPSMRNVLRAYRWHDKPAK